MDNKNITIELKNQNSNSRSLLPIWSWLYLTICFGYFLSKIFYNFVNFVKKINKTDFSKSIPFKKKFNLENIKKFIINSILEFFKNWIKRISDKFLMLLDAIEAMIKIFKILTNNFRSIFKFKKKKFKKNFRLLKRWLPHAVKSLWHLFQIVFSLVKEVFFVHSIIKFLIESKNFILFVIFESVCPILYIIYVGIFGILLGFLLGTQKRGENKYFEYLVYIYIFCLQYLTYRAYVLRLLKILFNKFGYDPLNFGYDPLNLKPEKVNKFSFQPVEPHNPSPSKLIMKEPDSMPELPLIEDSVEPPEFSIIADPDPSLPSIETDIFWSEPSLIKFEMFEFYQDINEKIKS